MYIFLLSHIVENQGFLDEEESTHCIKVLRKNAGDFIDAIDGKGNYYKCQILTAKKSETVVQLLEKTPEWGEKQGIKLTLAVSPLKQKERFEWLVEKAVELGVDEVVPLITKYTFTDNTKPERLYKLMLAATKQCKRSKIPILHPPTPFETFVQGKLADNAYLAYCQVDTHLFHYQTSIAQSADLLMMIGPEGDFTPQEVALAASQNIQAVGLGNSRLRTETAGICALSMLKGIRGW